ncbi:imidazole glycerol phosphate synthase subunit HisH [Candidatus Williamhamiltonella defendens]|uniref:imidazole glycerol phosphate synthase subunit HisH n=1 Tax=Candidatus Williamhamiltonella defendens TaxID=138072 RepID=UPI00130E7F70|nr:imidazole glycerol phosphate synthase subunit HisH [Candidatus Hamiltonella defensa]
MIAIVDYDIGNIAAVFNMLMRLGLRSIVTAKIQDIERASKIILPGNGSFDACMKNLRASGLIPVLEEKVLAQKVPLLGICVGAQMLGTKSEEGEESGLGWLNLQVSRFPDINGLRIPHMGWTEVWAHNKNKKNPLLVDMVADARFYFVHSYYMTPNNPEEIMFSAKYGIEFAAGVSRDNIAGVQFHPEKSHRFGKKLLNSFARGL